MALPKHFGLCTFCFKGTQVNITGTFSDATYRCVACDHALVLGDRLTIHQLHDGQSFQPGRYLAQDLRKCRHCQEVVRFRMASVDAPDMKCPNCQQSMSRLELRVFSVVDLNGPAEIGTGAALLGN
ncbi:hypothetical protein CL628_04345 [bacterium]|nr:hypothetical protein [bacterium]